MVLRFSQKVYDIQEIEERLTKLALQYKTEEVPHLPEPEIQEGKQKYTGLPAIFAYLDKLENEAHLWWYGTC